MTDDTRFPEKPAGDLNTWDETELKSAAAVLGAQWRDGILWIDFFNRTIGLGPDGFVDRDRLEITEAVKNVLTRYVSGYPLRLEETGTRLVSFREFEDAGPLVARFHANTSKTIESSFSGRMDLLEQKCMALGGKKVATSGFDLSVRFLGLPRLPVFFFFNDVQEGMPAAASFLFHENASRRLDLKSLMVVTTYLTGSLIRK